MNTYKIKALDGNKKLIFTVDAENLLAAQDEGRKKMKREGIRNGLLDTITELGPSKASSPAKPEFCGLAAGHQIACRVNEGAVPGKLICGAPLPAKQRYCLDGSLCNHTEEGKKRFHVTGTNRNKHTVANLSDNDLTIAQFHDALETLPMCKSGCGNYTRAGEKWCAECRHDVSEPHQQGHPDYYHSERWPR